MSVSIRLDYEDRRVGFGTRQRVAYRHAGTMCLFRPDVLSHDDYVCAPEMDSFSVEQARSIGRQLLNGATSGELAGGLRWEKASGLA